MAKLIDKNKSHNNLLVALNKEDEKFIDMINNELENLGSTKTKLSEEYQTLSYYKH